MRFRRNSAVDAEVPNSSMSDIAFLLLIFFMVTTAFAARKGIDFRLPAPAKDEDDIEQKDLKAVTIQVMASGRIVVDGIPKNLNEINSYLKPILASNPKKFVIIQMDMDASYGNMMDVLDELKQAEVQNIALPSKQEISAW